MAKLDFVCGTCGVVQENIWTTYGERPVCACGSITDILWATSSPTMIGDECDFTVENMSATPEHFTSKAEHRRRVKELGLVIKDRHLGSPGSDKSKLTTKWW